MSKKKRKGTPLLQKALQQGKVKVTQDGKVVSSQQSINVLAWAGSPLVITGFGIVMKKILTNLFRMYPGKYNIFHVGINYNGDSFEEFEFTGGPQNGRYKQWPAMQAGNGREQLYGQRKFLQILNEINIDFDVIFLFEDPFWVGGGIPGTNPNVVFMQEIKKVLANRGKSHIPIISYFPIDGVPDKKWVNNIAISDFPITYLPFGAEECIRQVPAIKDKLRIIPHGVDTKEFYPLSPKEIRTFKRVMFGDNFADKFMVLNVNRNQLRKLIPSTLLAFKEFINQVGDQSAFLYLNMKGSEAVGWNLYKICEVLGLSVGKHILFPPDFKVQKGLSQEDLNKVFNAADLLVSTACGGGWELAVTQAFATKTPVLVPQNTSHIDLCGDQSNLEEARGMLYRSGDSLSKLMFFTHDNDVPRPLPNLEDMVVKMKELYDNKEKRNKLSKNAYSWATSSLSWEKNVVPMFDQVFTEAKQLKDNRISAIKANQQATILGNKNTDDSIKLIK